MMSKNTMSMTSKKFTKRRILNKNPNWNHNNNNIFYQPTYGNIKYDNRVQKKEDVLRNFFQEWDKADKQNQAIMLENSEAKKRSRVANSYNGIESKSIESSSVGEKNSSMLNFDNKLKIDVLQSLIAISKTPAWFAECLVDAEKCGQMIYAEDVYGNKRGLSKYTSNLEWNNILRRENSVNSIKNDSCENANKKVLHPLSKVSLLNKTYFMILLISTKINPENFLKVIQYFQNYYPQTYDSTCSICLFLINHITDNLKRWSHYETSSTYMAREFFIWLCSDYDEKIVKRFQITKSKQEQIYILLLFGFCHNMLVLSAFLYRLHLWTFTNRHWQVCQQQDTSAKKNASSFRDVLSWRKHFRKVQITKHLIKVESLSQELKS